MEIRDKELYNGQWDSFDEYCQEMKMSESSASKIISIYSKCILRFGLPETTVIEAGGWSSVYEVMPMINTKKEAEYWLHLAKTLSRKDLRDEIAESKKGVSQAKCSHENSYEILVCRDCGVKIKTINENNS